MRLRIAGIAVLLGALTTGLCWISLQPSISVLLDAVRKYAPPGTVARDLSLKIRGALPLYLSLDFIVLALLIFIVLQLTVGRPLGNTERAIEQLARLDLDISIDSGGPLLSRLQRSLRQMAEALQKEQQLTQKQMGELRDANTRLGRAQTELVASDRLATVGKLAAGVAHEVGNPLAGILGYLSLARSRAKGNPELLDLVARIEVELQRIDQIIRSLLELGRPSRGKASPTQAATLIESSAKLLSSTPEFLNIELSSNCDPALYVIVEPGPVCQVMINLLLNASQAMAGKGSIRIDTQVLSDEKMLLFRVRDSGPGLSADVLANLFQPFFTTKEPGKGTGLGLAMSRHLLLELGGDLTAENHPEGGAVFTIRLPLA